MNVGDILYNDINKYINLANQGGVNTHLENEHIYIIPSLLLSGGKVLLDNEDPFITSCWSLLYKNPDGTNYQLTTREEVLANYDKFSEACKIISNVWPEMEFNIANTLRNIHIIESPYDDKHVSCTAANFFGSILVAANAKLGCREIHQIIPTRFDWLQLPFFQKKLSFPCYCIIDTPVDPVHSKLGNKQTREV